MREWLETLRPRETRMLRWSAAASATALWFSIAWRNPLVLLAIPLVGAGFAAFAFRNRQAGVEPEDDDADLL